MSDVVRFVAEQLSAVADSEKAAAMARCMKTTMPFYGVRKPAREYAKVAPDDVAAFLIEHVDVWPV